MIFARPGATFTAVLEGATPGLSTVGVRIENADGTNHTPRTTTGVVELEAGAGVYAKDDLVAPDDRGTYVVIWDTGGASPSYASEELVVTYTTPGAPSAGFATVEDVATRLGRSLSANEEETAQVVIDTVTGLIVDEVDRDSDWAAALVPVPPALKALCVEKAVAIVSNPAPGVIAAESLGAHSVTYARNGDGGLFLTAQEGRLARQAVYGTLSGSSDPRGVEDRVIDLNEGRDVDEAP